MKNLIGMTDFVMQESSNRDIVSFAQKVYDYANFMSQKLELWMFVPCKLVDGVWVALEEKKPFQDNYFEFQEAKKRCLFEDFEMDNSFVTHKSHNSFFYPISCLHEQTIEDLIKYNLELTKTAQKQIGL